MWKVLILGILSFFHKQKGLGYSFTLMYHFLEMGQERKQSFLKQGKN